MKRHRVGSLFPRCAALVGALSCFGVALSAPIDSKRAMDNVRDWLSQAPLAAFGLEGEPVDAFACGKDGALCFVVALSGRGHVIAAGDDTQPAVLAFSSENAVPGSSGTCVDRVVSDVFARAARGGLPVKRRVAASPGAGRPGVTEVIVGPLVGSHWGQTTDTGYANTGSFCYNLYTPHNIPCGCVATAMAQVMRFWRFPDRITPVTRICFVNGEAVPLAMTGGPYEWDRMPLDPAASGGTGRSEREAIGMLTYDCGVSVCAEYIGDSRDGAAAAVGVFAHDPLMKVFGFASARTYCPEDLRLSDVRSVLHPNLDAGCPVILMLSGRDDAHAVVADGYGTVDGEEFVHLNVGWTSTSGCDAWYSLSAMTFMDRAYRNVDGIVYNVFPRETGDILSGRIFGSDGTAVSNALVEVCESGKTKVLKTARTTASGVYSFVLPGGRKYDISAGDSVLRDVPLKASSNPKFVDIETGTYSPAGMAYGNSGDNDIVIRSASEEDDRVLTGPGLVWNEDGSASLMCELKKEIGPITVNAGGSVSVKGLPSGLKFDKRTGLIKGKPTKAVSDQPVTVTYPDPDNSRKKLSTILLITVSLPAPPADVGKFDGFISAENGDLAGTFTITASAKGKITVKTVLVADGKSTTSSWSAAKWDCADGESSSVEIVSKKKDRLFIGIDKTGPFGDWILTGELETAKGKVYALKGQRNPYQKTDGAYENPKAVSAVKALSKENKGKYNFDFDENPCTGCEEEDGLEWKTLSLSDSRKPAITLTVKSTGSVALSGTIEGAKASASSVILWEDDVPFACFLILDKKAKKTLLMVFSLEAMTGRARTL